MHFNRRSFMSTGAFAAAGATLPVSETYALAAEPLLEKDDMHKILDVMEQQIAKLRARIAESESTPIMTAQEVRRDACAIHLRSQMLTHRAETLRKLAFNQSLAEQQAIYEQRSREQFSVWDATQERIWRIMRLSRIVQKADKRAGLKQRCIALIDKECEALSDDYVRLFQAVVRTPDKPS